jgi:hypothetical protein
MLIKVLQIVTVVLVALAMIPAVAHALEWPGKMRLGKDRYFAVQRIYYPGFTFAGIGEPVGFISAIVLLILTPKGTAGFWLTLLAVVCLLGMQGVYWIFVHPVNKVWVQGESMSALGSGFFALGGPRVQSKTRAPEWTQFRNRWEHAHLVRAGLVTVSFLALVIAIS